MSLNPEIVLSKIHKYYNDALKEEGYMQMLFSDLNFLNSKQDIFTRVCAVDSYYGTQFFKHENAHRHTLEAIFCFKEKIKELSYFSLLEGGATYNEIDDLHNKLVIYRVHNLPGNNMAVHFSKYLHFCVPKLFPIFDSLAYRAWEAIFGFTSQNYGDLCKFYKENIWECENAWDGGLQQGRAQFERGLNQINMAYSPFKIEILSALDKFFYLTGKELER